MSTALITGASAGLGAEFARQIARLGHDVILVARRRSRLEALAASIRADYGVRAQVCVADLADGADVRRVAQLLAAPARPVSLLVNNAGFGLGQRFVGGDLGREQQALAVMVGAVMSLSHAAVHAMLRRGHGAIINVSSIAAGTAMGTYAAHKTWVEQFSASLAQELRGTHVTVTCLKPGTTRTEFFDRLGCDIDRLQRIGMLTPAFVVREALRDAGRGRATSVPGLGWRVLDVIDAKAPRCWVWRAAGYLRRTRVSV